MYVSLPACVDCIASSGRARLCCAVIGSHVLAPDSTLCPRSQISDIQRMESIFRRGVSFRRCIIISIITNVRYRHAVTIDGNATGRTRHPMRSRLHGKSTIDSTSRRFIQRVVWSSCRIIWCPRSQISDIGYPTD